MAYQTKMKYEDWLAMFDCHVTNSLGIYWDEFSKKPKTKEEEALYKAMIEEVNRDLIKIGQRIESYGERLRTGNV